MSDFIYKTATSSIHIDSRRTDLQLPVLGKPLPGFDQDLQNRPTVLDTEMRVLLTLVLTGQHFPQLTIYHFQNRLRQAFERLTVDQVAAGILEQSPFQIKVA